MDIKIINVEKLNKKNKYKVITSENEYIVSEDLLIKYQLFKDKSYSKKYFEEVLQSIIQDTFLNKIINLLSISNKSEYEVIKYIHTQEEKNNQYLTEKQINNIISILHQYNYLDDNKLSVSLIDYYIRNNKGPLFIKQKLKEKKIDEKMIIDNLKAYNSLKEEEIIIKIIAKESNANLPINKQKQNIIGKLLRNGFTPSLVYNMVNQTDFIDNSEQLIMKDYFKVFNKVKDKDKTDNEKKQVIINYLLNKGYDYQIIKEIINSSYNL